MSSITPVAWQVHCVAWDCAPDRHTPTTRPLQLAGTRRQVEAELRRRGWRPARTRGAWHCPTHVAQSGAADPR